MTTKLKRFDELNLGKTKQQFLLNESAMLIVGGKS